MVKKTQRRFIALIMSILLIVFGIIFIGVLVISNIANNRIITSRLDTFKIICERESNPVFPYDSIYAVVDFSTEVNGNHPIITLRYDSQIFTREQAISLVNMVKDDSSAVGEFGDYTYKIYPYNTVVLCNNEDVTSSFHGTLIATSIVLAIIYILLFLVVWAFSFRIIQPLQDSLDKQLQFISNASHELKTPITVISANADVLKTQSDSQWIDNIKTQTARMETLVSDMLILAKVDEGTITLSSETFNLSDEILSTVLPFDALAFEKGKHLEVDIPKDISYYGDRNSIRTILNILVDNAIKYSNSDGLIKISLKKANKTTITVFNTGSEIKSEDADKIFNRFYRGDNSRSRETGGSGLGLAIAKGIADNNKWKISAQSQPDEFMQFTIIL